MTINFSTNNIYQKFYKKAGISPQQGNRVENNTPTISVGEIKESSSRKKLFGIIGISAGSLLLLTVIGLFTLSKGFSGSVARFLKKISESAKKKIYDITAESKNLTVFQKAQLSLNKTVQNMADTLQATSNITALKDSFIQHWINKLKIPKVVDKINSFFKSITLKTKNNAYQSAEYSVVDFCNYVKKIASSHPDSIYASKLEEKANKILDLYMQNFSSTKHIKRVNDFWDSTRGLDKEVYNTLFKPEGGVFKNLKRFNSYITADIISSKRESFIKPVLYCKRQISNSLMDVSSEIKKALLDLKITVNPRDNYSIKSVKEISDILESNKSLSGVDEHVLRINLFNELKDKLSSLEKFASLHSKTKEQQIAVKKRVDIFKKLLETESYKKGLAQEAITDIKKMFEKSGGRNSVEYKEALKLANSMNKKINTAIEIENNIYEKLAELHVGSALTDILGILVPTAIGTLFVINSDDKQERISNTLTKGIPILGGVGVSYYGTTRGFTGVKNLVLSLITGYLLNMLGDKTDKFVKSHRKEQEKLRKAFEAFTKMQKTNTKIEKQVIANNEVK